MEHFCLRAFVCAAAFLLITSAYVSAINDSAYSGFIRIDIPDRTILYKQRVVDGITIEKDFSAFAFNKSDGSLVSSVESKRNISRMPKVKINRSQAESKVSGRVLFSEIYLISPYSDVFPIKPTPENPVWAVRAEAGGVQETIIIDAVNGRVLGKGISPPYTAFSLSGPVYSPCSSSWSSWYTNAAYWFNCMGYSAEYASWPAKDRIRSHIQSNETALFYELAHGGSTAFGGSCSNSSIEYTYSSDIRNWIANYAKMPFSFIGSCEGICDSGSGTLSYELRKGSLNKTATVGYCGMSSQDCASCWTYSVSWQNALFSYTNQSFTIKQAFDNANADYPMCTGCTRFVGDEGMKLVPAVQRVLSRCNNADINKDGLVDIGDLSILSGQWGTGGSADINRDGIVDIGDLSILSSSWGSSTGACE